MSWSSPIILLPLLLAGLGCLELGHRLRGRIVLPSSAAACLLLVIFLINIVCVSAIQAFDRERTTLVHQEADALGQAFRTSTLFPDLHRRWFRSQLNAFLEAELSDLNPGASAFSDPVEARVHPIFHQITQYDATMELPDKFENRREYMMTEVSNLVSLHYRMRYALRERFPEPLWFVLVLSLLLGSCLTGYLSQSAAQRDYVCWAAYLILTLSIFAVIQDFDDPLTGWIRTPFDNLRELKVALMRDPT